MQRKVSALSKMDRVEAGGLSVARELHDFVNDEALPGTGVTAEQFWSGLDRIVHDLAPVNRELLATRDRMQAGIDRWHREHRGQAFDSEIYQAFLRDIGYLLPEGPDFSISTENVDPEIAEIAGPQLVVPITNARYALNAANARWGSLYDALYGTDAIPLGGGERRSGYDPERGRQVIDYARNILDEVAPLTGYSWRDATGFHIDRGRLVVSLGNWTDADLAHAAPVAGYRGAEDQPEAILLKHNGLHLEIRIDREHLIGRGDPAGIADVVLESAVTTIMDFEDSIAAVDAADKVLAYRNWLGLMRGDLTASFDKGGRTVERALNPDRTYDTPGGGALTLSGRSLMLVRNVGHLMTIDAVLDRDGRPAPEGILDGMVTAAIALHDIGPNGRRMNSRAGSMYIVKPKMHGPEEVAFSDTLLGRIEDALGLPRFSLKMGIMDEERRTTLNLKESIRAAKDRIVFINI